MENTVNNMNYGEMNQYGKSTFLGAFQNAPKIEKEGENSPIIETALNVLAKPNEQENEKVPFPLNAKKFDKIHESEAVDHLAKLPKSLFKYILKLHVKCLQHVATTNRRNNEIAKQAISELLDQGKIWYELGFKSLLECSLFLGPKLCLKKYKEGGSCENLGFDSDWDFSQFLGPQYCLDLYNEGKSWSWTGLGFKSQEEFFKYVSKIPDLNQKLRKCDLHAQNPAEIITLLDQQLKIFPNLDSLSVSINTCNQLDQHEILLMHIAEKIPQLISLTWDLKIIDTHTKHLKKFKSLEFLEIDCSHLTNLSFLKELNLKTLKLESFQGNSDKKFHLPNKLENLHLENFSSQTSLVLLQTKPTLKSVVFRNCPKLADLDFKLSDSSTENTIESLEITSSCGVPDSTAFKDLNMLKVLKINLCKVLDTKILPKNAQVIEFYKIKNMNKVLNLDGLDKLKNLKLSTCGNLEEIIFPQNSINNLQNISLESLKLPMIPSFETFKNLAHLKIRECPHRNNLTLPNNLKSFSIDNRIHDQPTVLDNLENLKRLKLKTSKTLNMNFLDKLSELTILDIKGVQKIYSARPSITISDTNSYKNLKIFKIYGTHPAQEAWDISNLFPNLAVLDINDVISNNRQVCIQNFPKLKILSVQHCHLKSLRVETLPQLKELVLRGNTGNDEVTIPEHLEVLTVEGKKYTFAHHKKRKK